MAPGGFHAALQSMYGERVPTSLGEPGYITRAEQEQYDILMPKK